MAMDIHKTIATRLSIAVAFLLLALAVAVFQAVHRRPFETPVRCQEVKKQCLETGDCGQYGLCKALGAYR